MGANWPTLWRCHWLGTFTNAAPTKLQVYITTYISPYWFKPRPYSFFQRLAYGGGPLEPPCRSAHDGAKASRKKSTCACDERKPMIPNFKVLGHWLAFQVRSMTQKSGKSGPVGTSLSELVTGFFGALITNFMLVLITDDVFMHLGQVGSGQVRSTSRRPAG